MSNRLRAIQHLASLAVAGIPEEHFDPVADQFTACLMVLGVSVDEIRDAMQFALITGE